MKHLIITTTLFALCSGSTLAQTVPATPLQPAATKPTTPAVKTLTVGDKAPSIELTNTYKGETPSSFENDHVYVVEFWATWCPPCRASMPHLTTLQAEYGDRATIIGISDEDVDTVDGFLKKSDDEGMTWNDKVQYTLTSDPDRSAHDDYMKAAGQNGIPTAFIVGKDAHIEWIGHPMTMDEPLKNVVNGTWDRGAFATAFKKEQEQEKAMRALMTDVRSAQTPAEVKAVVGKIDTVLADDPSNLNLQMMKYDLLLNKANDQQGAADCGEAVAKANWDSSGLLNAMSWNTISTEGASTRLVALATEWAQQADALTDHSDASIIDTLARCYFVQGDVLLAIETQKKAIKASDPESAKSLKDTLAEYEATLDKA